MLLSPRNWQSISTWCHWGSCTAPASISDLMWLWRLGEQEEEYPQYKPECSHLSWGALTTVMRWVPAIWFLQVADAYEGHKAEEAYLWIDLKTSTGLWEIRESPRDTIMIAVGEKHRSAPAFSCRLVQIMLTFQHRAVFFTVFFIVWGPHSSSCHHESCQLLETRILPSFQSLFQL